MKAIMYHYVRPYNPRLPILKHLHIDDFCKQLDYFQENYHFIDKQDFLSYFETANSKQQTANSKQQTANSKQQTANSKQWYYFDF